MPDFDKWWDDLKKHRKRLRHWLPHWREHTARIAGQRPVRYFTLCARSMIDVFLLVSENILTIDPLSHAINRVQFCECDDEQFTEIREMIVREDAGFYGRLEDIVLFHDDDFTAQCPTAESINRKLENEGLELQQVDRLILKRTHFNVMASFPYDFINLDFCQYYYPTPPNMLRINETVTKVLDWQTRASDDPERINVDEFILAVTCRHDSDFPPEAQRRLQELIRSNCDESDVYRTQVERTRPAIEQWSAQAGEDFFFSGWPKDIARSARERRWSMQVLDYVYYYRTGDDGDTYAIVCLVARFQRSDQIPDYIPVALSALDPATRTFIPDIIKESDEGRQLLTNLRAVVAVRNEQASRQKRELLPQP